MESKNNKDIATYKAHQNARKEEEGLCKMLVACASRMQCKISEIRISQGTRNLKTEMRAMQKEQKKYSEIYLAI